MPIIAGMVHPEGAVNRHDAVAWGYSRAASSLGVEIHQNTKVNSLLKNEDGTIRGVSTVKGDILADRVAVAVSGHTTQLTDTVGLRLPLRSFNLSAFVSEPIKPMIDVVVNCPDLGVYLSQTAKGELVIGGAPDPGQSFRRGTNQLVFERTVGAMLRIVSIVQEIEIAETVGWYCGYRA